MAREIALEDNVSAELLGPGDLVRPWQAQQPSQLMRAEVRWTVVEEVRFGILDRHFAVQLARYPEVNAMLIDRLTERAQRLAMMQAISQLNGVERRLLALFWHLSERWGRVVRDGVAVPVPLPHRVIAQLVGARRPTVSTALGTLAERGELVRRADGGWLLTGEPVGVPTDEAARIIRSRRRRFPAAETVEVPVDVATAQLAATGRIADLHDALDVLKADSRRHRENFEALRQEALTLQGQISARRERQRVRARLDAGHEDGRLGGAAAVRPRRCGRGSRRRSAPRPPSGRSRRPRGAPHRSPTGAGARRPRSGSPAAPVHRVEDHGLALTAAHHRPQGGPPAARAAARCPGEEVLVERLLLAHAPQVLGPAVPHLHALLAVDAPRRRRRGARGPPRGSR